MNFDKTDLEILNNYASINANMMFREGREIRTISPAKNIFSVAVISADIPQEFAIFDLGNFLSVLDMSEGDLSFDEKFVEVPTTVGDIRYYFSNPELILAAPTKSIKVDEEFVFTLSADEVTKIQKIGALLGAPHLSLKAKDGKVTLSLADRKNSSSNMFKKVVGDYEGDFDVFVSLDALKIVPREYTVAVSKKKVMYFDGTDVRYWISVDAGSKI